MSEENEDLDLYEEYLESIFDEFVIEQEDWADSMRSRDFDGWLL